jgi:hypothetical protein
MSEATKASAHVMQVSALVVTYPSAQDMPDVYREIHDELASITTELKRRLGHNEHEGWKTDVGMKVIICGCGDELMRLP